MFTSVVVVLLLTTLSVADDSLQFPQHPYRMVCHMTFEDANFTVADAEPGLPMSTHIVYNYVNINGSSFQLSSTRDFGEEGIKRMVSFKKKFPYLKTMIGVGGPGNNTTHYSKMAATPETRSTFVDSVVKFLLDHGLDGMDFDWRDPGKADKLNFVQLVKELRQQFDKHHLILSLTLTGTVTSAHQVIDPKALAEHAHFVNLRTFNFKRDWEDGQTVEHISPAVATNTFNVEWSLQYFERSGVPGGKINVGISSSFKIYFLLDANATGDVLGSPIRDSTPISHYEFCKMKEREGGWVEEWDNFSKASYSRKGNRVVSHENFRSADLKIMQAIVVKELGGIAYYGLENDDYSGDCVDSGGKYPMLRNIDKTFVIGSNYAYTLFFNSRGQFNARYWWSNGNYGVWDEEEDA